MCVGLDVAAEYVCVVFGEGGGGGDGRVVVQLGCGVFCWTEFFVGAWVCSFWARN